MIQYPIQSHYSDTERTNPCNGQGRDWFTQCQNNDKRQARNTRVFYKSLLWHNREQNSRSSPCETSTLPNQPSPYIYGVQNTGPSVIQSFNILILDLSFFLSFLFLFYLLSLCSCLDIWDLKRKFCNNASERNILPLILLVLTHIRSYLALS